MAGTDGNRTTRRQLTNCTRAGHGHRPRVALAIELSLARPWQSHAGSQLLATNTQHRTAAGHNAQGRAGVLRAYKQPAQTLNAGRCRHPRSA
ncbi:hypothetical protein BD413DRAFT_505110 [Trametes elegans]|nr:hypothetical protein BD413DRAFT_505110 [Trametes elegans]